MSLGTKVLLITLSITLGLAGLVIWVVTAAVTAREVDRAHDTIHAAVTNYFARVDFQRQRVASTVRLLLEDQQQRSQFERADSPDNVDRNLALTQLHDQVFNNLLQTELTEPDGLAPDFHVLTDAGGRVIVTAAPKRPELEPALANVTWIGPSIVAVAGTLDRDVLIGGELYIVFGNRVHTDFSQEPTHIYFTGFHLDEKLLEQILGRVDPKMSGPALTGWMMIDGRTIARGADWPAGDAGAAEAVRQIESLTPRTSSRDNRTRIDFRAAGERFLGESFGFTPATNTHGTFAVISSLDRALEPLHRIQRNIALVTVIVILVAIIASRVLSVIIAKPVRQLVDATKRVSRGDFTSPIPEHRRDELGDLARSFNTMAAGLAQRDVIKDTFGKFVDPSVVDALLRDPAALRRGERRVQTVLFSDLSNFTTLSERLAPEDQVRLLNAHLGDAADTVTGLGGIVDKFIGDSVMAFWGPPLTQQHAALACRAALRLVERTRQHDDACRRLGVELLRVRIGIATGEVVVGVIGSASKFNYTVMGDVANVSARLEGVNKIYGTQILVAASTAREAAGDGAILTRKLDIVRLAGRAEATEIFEVVAESERATAEQRQTIERYAHAFAFYEARDWPASRAAFEVIASDPPSAAMAERCRRFEASPPPPEWDGVWQLDSK